MARAKAAGLSWLLPEAIYEAASHERFYGRATPSLAGVRHRAELDLEYLYRELKQ